MKECSRLAIHHPRRIWLAGWRSVDCSKCYVPSKSVEGFRRCEGLNSSIQITLAISFYRRTRLDKPRLMHRAGNKLIADNVLTIYRPRRKHNAMTEETRYSPNFSTLGVDRRANGLPALGLLLCINVRHPHKDRLLYIEMPALSSAALLIHKVYIYKDDVYILSNGAVFTLVAEMHITNIIKFVNLY